MDGTGQIADAIALVTGVAWASGVNLYAALLSLGLMALYGGLHLPPELQVLAHPWVIGAAGLMYVVEFIADKVPGVDTVWDTLHTFIRIPAGAILAAGAVGEVEPAMVVAASLVGGTVSAGSHAIKAGTRVLVNTSPEPFTNWSLSFSEDVAVLGGLWAAVHHPWFFLSCFALLTLGAIWLMPRLWRGVSQMGRHLAGLVGRAARKFPN